MGAYLTQPKTDKVSSDQVGKNLIVGASSMQGWRQSQEDAHNCCIDFDEDCSLFAVYDGHGGSEVATYCSNNLPDFIKNTEAYKWGDIKQALIDAFLGFDATLTKPEIISILKDIARSQLSDNEAEKGKDSDVEENVNNLRIEAAMPLDQVMAKYSAKFGNLKFKPLVSESCASPSNFQSPYLRSGRSKDKGACSSSGAGCSTSSTSWNSNETDVGSSADSGSAKSSEMPDSSEDVSDTVSPSKATNSTITPNEAETNGEQLSKSFEDADSSKNTGDNECSSSCTPVENGEAEQQEKISSSGRMKKQLINLYKSIITEAEDDSDDDDDDDDDENDKNFDGQPQSDDEGDVENDDSNEEEDDTEDDDEEDEEDEEEEEDEPMSSLDEEPGSDSGCTAVVAILKGNELYVANAGDSRCVLCRDGKAVELSFDHKPEDQPEMQRIVKAGGKVTADGRVNGGLNLSRALGDHAYKKNKDLPPEEQMISALPDIKTVTLDLEKDEFMVLACDGIWNFMSSQNVIDYIRSAFARGYDNVSKICEELFDYCLAPNTLGDGTGCDNMTAIIVKFKSSKTGNGEGTAAEVTTVTKKRPVSPSTSAEGTECNSEKTEDNVIDECKRFKAETC
ncbi:probable protein phosphatase CG10417 isoform X2 [Nasonia vitripennis]|uniref:protein-serine/threonine phosphatase n=1 Tax=Nasonia vitripennis TaxID=7425 RepID=A0A7M7Q0F2_NASVI|nr:probable protein phosphatase CG10417 isoform X2 [Nasonia vitripennis]